MQRIEVHKIAEEARFNGFHMSVLIWCFAILMIDGYDIAVVGAALPAMMKDMGGQATVVGFMASSGLFGMALGAILFGTLAERIGRRWSLALCVFLFSVFYCGGRTFQRPFCILRVALHSGHRHGRILPQPGGIDV